MIIGFRNAFSEIFSQRIRFMCILIIIQEEQRVIEAKIRMRQQELQDEEERMHKRLEMSSSNVNVAVADVEYSSNAGNLSTQFWISSVYVYVINPSCMNYSFISIL